MLLLNVVLSIFIISYCYGQFYNPYKRLRNFPIRNAWKLRNRLAEKLFLYRQRTTERICYETVGCFDLTHSRSPLQGIPENPKLLETKFYLLRRGINVSEPEILHYDDGGASIDKTKFNASQPTKVIIHGYMSKWDEKGAILGTDAYLKLDDYNVVLMDWSKGARGPQYVTAAANTEVVGRQLGMLLLAMVNKGLKPKNIHVIGFSLGAHIAGIASETLKAHGHLIGRITGLDAASPLFRNNHLREKHKKLDKEDASLVDVIHTDASPTFTDGFGLWQPIGHVDFFPNGGQQQPGCVDQPGSVVVTHLEKSLTYEIACSHIRAWKLFMETIVMKAEKNTCEFIAFNCAGGLPDFNRGHCFPLLDKSENSLSLSYRNDVGIFGEEVKGEGVMYFVTRDSPPFCGTQLQASIFISQKTSPSKGILQLHLQYANHTTDFVLKCEVLDFIMTGSEMNGLAVAEYDMLDPKLLNVKATLSYLNLEYENTSNETANPTLYFDRVVVRDMYGNSWQYCGKDTVLQDNTGLNVDIISLNLNRERC